MGQRGARLIPMHDLIRFAPWSFFNRRLMSMLNVPSRLSRPGTSFQQDILEVSDEYKLLSPHVGERTRFR